MNRVIAAEVKELITTVKEDGVLESNFIDTAHTLVDTYLLGTGQSAGILKKIELYLAAHFVAITEEIGGIVRDAYGDSSVTLADVYGPGLKSTRFGLVALALDGSGVLTTITTAKLYAQLRLV